MTIRYFNALGIVGWGARCRIGASEIGRRSLRAYERLLKACRPIEDRISTRFGLSPILEAKRPEGGSGGDRND